MFCVRFSKAVGLFEEKEEEEEEDDEIAVLLISVALSYGVFKPR